MIKIVKDVTFILGERKNIDMMKKSTRRQLEMKQVRKNLCEYSFIKNMQVVKMREHQRVKQVNQKTVKNQTGLRDL